MKSTALLVVVFLAFSLVSPLWSQERLPLQNVDFSSRRWIVRRTTKPEGPGGNTFGGKDINVIKNEDGSLTLKIFQKEGIWYAAEVTSQERMGYGEYIFRLRTPPKDMDPHVVLGLFTYSGGAAYNHREIDIEFSAWGVTTAPIKGQYVIQPYQNPGQLFTFDMSRIREPASYSFKWTEGRIDFSSWKGYGPRPEDGSPDIIAAWSFADPKAVPKPSPNVHMNLYLAKGTQPPSGRGLIEVTIDSFEFKPFKK
jgi:hypothetical protein